MKKKKEVEWKAKAKVRKIQRMQKVKVLWKLLRLAKVKEAAKQRIKEKKTRAGPEAWALIQWRKLENTLYTIMVWQTSAYAVSLHREISGRMWNLSIIIQPEIQLGGSQWYSWLQSCWLRRSLLRAYYAGECPHSPGRISCLSPSISRGSWVLELCANIGWNYAVHVAEKYGKFEPKPWWALSGTQMEPSKNIWAVSKSQIGVKTVVPPSWTARGSAMHELEALLSRLHTLKGWSRTRLSRMFELVAEVSPQKVAPRRV